MEPVRPPTNYNDPIADKKAQLEYQTEKHYYDLRKQQEDFYYRQRSSHAGYSNKLEIDLTGLVEGVSLGVSNIATFIFQAFVYGVLYVLFLSTHYIKGDFIGVVIGGIILGITFLLLLALTKIMSELFGEKTYWRGYSALISLYLSIYIIDNTYTDLAISYIDLDGSLWLWIIYPAIFLISLLFIFGVLEILGRNFYSLFSKVNVIRINKVIKVFVIFSHTLLFFVMAITIVNALLGLKMLSLY